MAIIRNRFTPGDEQAWTDLRNSLKAQGRLGGSMVGVAAGCSPYKSSTRMWAEMKGLIEEPDISGREAIRDGKDHEDYVAKRFSELSGKTVHRENCIFTNDAYPHLFASIDRKIENEDSGLECKTASALSQDKFTDTEFPKTYYAQVCSYLAVTGMSRWYLCVWCMGVFVKCYMLTTVEADLDNPPSWCVGVFYVAPEELQACETIAANFIASLDQDHPSTFDGSDDEASVLKELHPTCNGATVDLGGDVALLLDERAYLKELVDEKETRIAQIENAIRETLGDDELGLADGWKVSYKNNKPSSRTDWQAVAKMMGATDDVVNTCTVVKDGVRTLRISRIKK